MSTISDYPPAAPNTRRSSAIRQAWGTPPPRDVERVPFTFHDGTEIPGGVNARIVTAVKLLDIVLAKHNYRLDATADEWCYARRLAKYGNVPSLHSWAIALDLNATRNPFSYRFATDMSPTLVAGIQAIRIGNVPVWAWGGQWGRVRGQRYDTMHWQINLTPAECDTLTAVYDKDQPMTPAERSEFDALARRVDLLTSIVGEKLDAATVVHALYRRVFGRAADDAGLAFYAHQLDTGAQTAEQIEAELVWKRETQGAR